MKKFNVLIVRSFLQSFFPTFVIVMFILLMQVVWLYVDELVGKGLEWTVIAELMFYFSASLIPQALPLSVLLASIMTFGNLGESYELVAAKAAGISTMKIFRPMMLVMVGISLFAFFVSNILIPQANLKRSSLLYDVRQQKPSLAITEGVFYTGIEGITMRVGKKDKKTQEMYDIMIYDQRENNTYPVIITAKRGTMGMSEDKRYLFFKLYDGARYEEMEKQQGYYNSYPHTKASFSQEQIAFDLNNFKFNRTDESLFKHHFEMLNIVQLGHNSDSLDSVAIMKSLYLKTLAQPYCQWLPSENDSNYLRNYKTHHIALADSNVMSHFTDVDKSVAIINAANNARAVKNMLDYSISEFDDLTKLRARHKIEWHRKLTLAVACFVMFFIGAPLGSIIRKGGFGLPIVISVLLYLGFHIVSLTGEKAAKTLAWTPLDGMWMPIAVLLPLGLFITFQASNDSQLLDKSAWVNLFKRIFRIKHA
jgi:lipopolysaccharide export system permease protein